VPAIAALVLLLGVAGARAGQRRIDVGTGGFSFGPSSQTLNINDQVTWVGVGGSHTVTSGTGPSDPGVGSLFNAGISGTGQAFTWKADRTGSVDYFCSPHFSFGMTGQLQISASGVAVSSFRITEVQYNDASGHDRIEITNLGGDFGDLGRYRIAINGTSSAIVPLTSVGVVSGATPGRVVVHTNEGTTGSTQTNLFMAIGDLSDVAGSVALYVPNTTSTLTDQKQIVDFVQWGAGSQPNATTAVAANVWPSTGDFVPLVPVSGNYDIAFCGTESQHDGSVRWSVAHPNFGTASLCSTPTFTTTWGRIKQLYR
jgi:plastocyanin